MLTGSPKNQFQGRRQVLHPSGMGAQLPRVACLPRRRIWLSISFWVVDAGRKPDEVELGYVQLGQGDDFSGLMLL